ncbi:MAG: hypothetical protein KDC44_24655, partial [Phaeodactylibacter sp.]|nr:hypothetical protein [Phaeodactylibacter sp.]
NNGSGQFSFKAFPVEAQFAPINDILVKDCDGDGQSELLLVQNSYQSDVETGRYDAGNGVMLSRAASGAWTVIPNAVSGFWATEEARAIKVLHEANGKELVLIANNDSALEAYQLLH